MSDYLKGSYKLRAKPKAEVASEDAQPDAAVLSEEVKKRALASICGSMVYVERTSLTWDGDEDDESSPE